ncbi:hypothetical protein F8M41_008994 [Gigaspora margarita]|uniref:Uncharacterized protein n=1 Tax=Gigaspora margarita TaxID=4874 RepID=A0A8H3X2M4_GIGMA|nr:hypothetical protein F8M41_008994 [Gigaspora margarita]
MTNSDDADANNDKAGNKTNNEPEEEEFGEESGEELDDESEALTDEELEQDDDLNVDFMNIMFDRRQIYSLITPRDHWLMMWRKIK